MNDSFQIDAPGPGALIIRLISLITTMRDKIQKLEENALKHRQCEYEVRAKMASNSCSHFQETTEFQKENSSSKENQMRQNVIPILNMQIQSLTSKLQSDALEIKHLGLEKEQLVKDMAILKRQVVAETINYIQSSHSSFFEVTGHKTQGSRPTRSLPRSSCERKRVS